MTEKTKSTLLWVVMVLCAVGIGVAPMVVIGSHPEIFSGHPWRRNGVVTLVCALLVPTILWAQSRLRGRRARGG